MEEAVRTPSLREKVLQQLKVKPLPVSEIKVENSGEEQDLPKLLESLIAEGQVQSHEFRHPTVDTSLVLYFLPFPKRGEEKENEVPSLPIEKTAISSPVEPPTTPQSTPIKANHLNRPMSASLKSRLGKRRPSNFISPSLTKSPSKNEEAGEEKEEPEKEQVTPLKKRRLLHSPKPKDPQTSPSKMSPEEERSLLLAQIKKKQEQLEEFKRKRYLAEQKFSNKEEQEKVKSLIEKWRGACQEVIVELHNNALGRTPDITIPQLLEYLHIDPQTVNYSVTEERFL